MKITEQQFEAFLDDLEFRDVVIPSTGEVVQMPLISKHNPSMTAAFTANRTKVLKLLKLPELVPADLGGDRTLITFTAIDYAHRNLDPYKEIIVGIPVRVGLQARGPTPADLVAPEFGGAEIYIRHLIVDTRLSEILGNELLGYNKFIADISFDQDEAERSVVVSEGGRKIFSLRIMLPKHVDSYEYVRDDNPVVTHKLGKLNHLSYPVAMKLPQPQPTKATVSFGDHPLGRILAGLDISTSEPVLVRWVPDWRLYSDERKLRTTEPSA